MKFARLRPAGFFLLSVIFVYAIFNYSFFIFHFTHGPARLFARGVIAPAVFIKAGEASSQKTLSYSTILELARAAEAFGQAQGEEAFDEGLKSGVHRLYIEQLANELGVITNREAIAHYEVNEELIASGLSQAGWTVDDYRQFVVAPLLLSQGVEQAVALGDAGQEAAKNTLEEIMKKIDDGMPFRDVAEYFSEDISAKNKGDLGLMKVSEVPHWLRPALTLQISEHSEILSGPEAYWVVELLSREKINGEEYVRFRGIAVKKLTLGEIIATRRQANPPLVLVW